MGYSTQYTLTWKAHGVIKSKPSCEHNPPTWAKFCPTCGAPVGFASLDCRIAEYIKEHALDGVEPNGKSKERCKWYHHEIDMAAVSHTFPDVLFTLSGEGEESGDIWKKYFLNGMVQLTEASIVFDEFDPSKLTEPK